MPKSAQRFESFAALYDKLCQILFYIFEGFFFSFWGFFFLGDFKNDQYKSIDMYIRDINKFIINFCKPPGEYVGL